MADDSDDRRDALEAFLQSQGPPTEDTEVPEGASVLTGWVMVAEWMDENGDRWLSRGWAASKAKWEAHGMMHEVIYGNWDDA